MRASEGGPRAGSTGFACESVRSGPSQAHLTPTAPGSAFSQDPGVTGQL